MSSTSKPLYLKALEALRHREALFRIMIFTLVTVGFWIGFSIFFSQQKTKVAIDIQKHTEPLNPNINKATLEELATRKTFSDEELQNFPVYDRIIDDNKVSKLIIAGTESDATTPITNSGAIATPSATPEIVPVATDSGNF